jgi:hypothetical protein
MLGLNANIGQINSALTKTPVQTKIRISKLETISNIKFFNVQNKSLGIQLFRAFEHSNLEFVSDFVIRISNFKIQKLRVFVKTLLNN